MEFGTHNHVHLSHDDSNDLDDLLTFRLVSASC